MLDGRNYLFFVVFSCFVLFLFLFCFCFCFVLFVSVCVCVCVCVCVFFLSFVVFVCFLGKKRRGDLHLNACVCILTQKKNVWFNYCNGGG